MRTSCWGLKESCRPRWVDSGDINNIENRDFMQKLWPFADSRKILVVVMWRHRSVPHGKKATMSFSRNDNETARGCKTCIHNKITCGNILEGEMWINDKTTRGNKAMELHHPWAWRTTYIGAICLPIQPIKRARLHLIHSLIQPEILWTPSRAPSPDTP